MILGQALVKHLFHIGDAVWFNDFHLYLYSGNFMYFIGYSKWLLLSSRLVAGDTRTHMHVTK